MHVSHKLSGVQTASAPDHDLHAHLLAAKSGLSDAAGSLLERYRDYLLLIANAETPSDIRAKVGASDLVQQSIAEAWQSLDQFNGNTEGELRAWLRNILLNNVRDTTRGFCFTAKRETAREIPLSPNDSSDAWGGAIASADPSPSKLAAANEELALVREALGRLPNHYAQVIRLRNLEYLGFEEIAARMDLGRDQARKLWERAVRRLARELKQES
jgi:RNA polymerase sigma-70 factor (ECF subfamily)